MLLLFTEPDGNSTSWSCKQSGWADNETSQTNSASTSHKENEISQKKWKKNVKMKTVVKILAEEKCINYIWPWT